MRNAWRKIGEKNTERMFLTALPPLCFFFVDFDVEALVELLVRRATEDDDCFSSFSTSSNSDSASASYPIVWSYIDRKPNKKNKPVAT
jgi:hypothetical protein